jgi:hypothetical protein
MYEIKNEDRVALKENQPEKLVLASLSPEYAEMEEFYVSRINFTISELNQYEPDPEMMAIIEDLDKEFKALQAEMNGPVNQDEIIEAMIENYRLKLDLLEQMLESLKEQKTVVNDEKYTSL